MYEQLKKHCKTGRMGSQTMEHQAAIMDVQLLIFLF